MLPLFQPNWLLNKFLNKEQLNYITVNDKGTLSGSLCNWTVKRRTTFLLHPHGGSWYCYYLAYGPQKWIVIKPVFSNHNVGFSSIYKQIISGCVMIGSDRNKRYSKRPKRRRYGPDLITNEGKEQMQFCHLFLSYIGNQIWSIIYVHPLNVLESGCLFPPGFIAIYVLSCPVMNAMLKTFLTNALDF